MTESSPQTITIRDLEFQIPKMNKEPQETVAKVSKTHFYLEAVQSKLEWSNSYKFKISRNQIVNKALRDTNWS